MTKYVLNIPPKPQPSPRFNGKGQLVETKEIADWKKAVGRMLRARQPKIINNGSIFIAMTFYLYPPQTISKKDSRRALSNLELERIFVEKKPCSDDLTESFLNAACGILYKNNEQIAVLSTQKLYSLNPRIEITIEKLEENK